MGGRRAWLLLTAIVLTGVNLRTAVTTVGPLLEELQRGLGMSPGVAGLLTTLPVVCFAVLGSVTPALVRRFGEQAVVAGALAVTSAGLLARALAGSVWVFLLMSVLALAGGAVGNVVLPALVKRHFPERTGAVVAAYTTALAAGQAAGAALAVPVARFAGEQGWRLGIGIWAAMAALAVLPWLPLLAVRRDRDGTAGVAPRSTGLAHTRLAWALALFFGTQSAQAYIVFGWFAQFFRETGVSAARAGLLAASVSVLVIPMSLLVPSLAGRMRTQRPIVLVLTACCVLAYIGMLTAPVAGAWLWMLLVGLGLGLFPLALTMIGLRARSAATTGALSAFVQGIGYVLAGTGPLLVGVLRGVTGGWGAPFALMFALCAVMIIVGWYAAGDRYVEDELRSPAPAPIDNVR
ncbi:MAG: MFS transporter [Pseudonocardiaceae bacterium]|nr:MFS transporter [Pseudonocardiaceae bacterium]